MMNAYIIVNNIACIVINNLYCNKKTYIIISKIL